MTSYDHSYFTTPDTSLKTDEDLTETKKSKCEQLKAEKDALQLLHSHISVPTACLSHLGLEATCDRQFFIKANEAMIQINKDVIQLRCEVCKDEYMLKSLYTAVKNCTGQSADMKKACEDQNCPSSTPAQTNAGQSCMGSGMCP